VKVAIVGAGPSGLVTCKTLRERGLAAVCFEAGDRVGGQWVIDNTSGTSAAYRSLRTNTNRVMSRFSDFAFPDDYPDFPGHAEMAAWFESYARHFGVLEHVRFRSRVTGAVPLADGGFSVETEAGDREEFDALVAASGNLWDPVTPDFAGSFAGPLFHSKSYRDATRPVDCRGRTVLVVGLGNTACEIAVELASAGGASRVLLAARSGQLIMPRTPSPAQPPHPAEPAPLLFRLLPRVARDALFRGVFRLIVKRMLRTLPRPQDVGLPAPPRDPLEKRAVANDHVLGMLQTGAIAAMPGVRAFDGKVVEFTDGSREAADVVICATGYRFSLPFLSREVLGVEDARDLRLYQGTMHPRYPRLFVVGVMRALCSIWPRSEQQARWIAAVLREEFVLPDERRRQSDAYFIQQGPVTNCQFHTIELEREMSRAVR